MILGLRMRVGGGRVHRIIMIFGDRVRLVVFHAHGVVLIMPFQWPDEADLSKITKGPGFKTTFERYLAQVEKMGYEIARLIGESLGIGEDGIMGFYDEDKLMQHRAKVS